MGFVQEFRTFAVRGNMVDMAVGIIIGAAFGKVVSSLVGDVLMPPLGLMVGGTDFANLAVTLKAATPDGAAVTLGYGKFIQAIVDFVIIAFAVFVVVKGVNRLREEKPAEPPPPAEPPREQVLLTEIRDLLKTNR
jgi:large conductance mechanosensitive channel